MQCLVKLNICMGIKLSEVLDRLIKIQKLDFESSITHLNSYIKTVNQNVNDLPFINRHELSLLEKNLQENIKQYQNKVIKLEEKLKAALFENQKEYIETSKNIWKINSEKMLFAEHLEWTKLWPPSEVELETFIFEIKKFTNWQYGGLIVGAKNSNIIKAITGIEPLYVIEQYPEYFNLQKEKFHQDFIRKIRCYDINDINRLPDNSLGIAVIYNEFSFLPWDIINNILYHISNKLMPGGILIFNYNDCETVRGFREFENHSMTYSVPKMYEDLLSKYKMSCVGKYNSTKETFSMLTFKKEGSKNLIKRYPSVGFIQEQPTFSNQKEHEQKIDTVKKVIKAKSI
jgi:hypothetical protein